MTELEEIAASLLPRAQAGGLTEWPTDRLRAWVTSWLDPQESPQVIDGVLESLQVGLGITVPGKS